MANTKCPICGFDNRQTEPGQSCALCAADFREPERKLLETLKKGSYATADKVTAIRMEASIYLTDRRVIVIPLKLSGYGLTGVLTAAAYNKMTSKNGVISLPLTQVTDVRDGKFGFVKALILDTRDGDLLKIAVPGRDEWRDAIERARTAAVR